MINKQPPQDIDASIAFAIERLRKIEDLIKIANVYPQELLTVWEAQMDHLTHLHNYKNFKIW